MQNITIANAILDSIGVRKNCQLHPVILNDSSKVFNASDYWRNWWKSDEYSG